jgi:REP element-mobilizing transposase RayT
MPKDREKVLRGQVAKRTRDILRQIAMEHEILIVLGEIAVGQPDSLES